MQITRNTLNIRHNKIDASDKEMCGEVVFTLGSEDVKLLEDLGEPLDENHIREFFIDNSRLTQLNKRDMFVPIGWSVVGWKVEQINGLLITVVPVEFTDGRTEWVQPR